MQNTARYGLTDGSSVGGSSSSPSLLFSLVLNKCIILKCKHKSREVSGSVVDEPADRSSPGTGSAAFSHNYLLSPVNSPRLSSCTPAWNPNVLFPRRGPDREGERREHHREDVLTGHSLDPEQVGSHA